MQYFNSLPKVVQIDSKSVPTVLTNIMARSSIIPSLLKNPMVFYRYDVQDDDTPEIVADKYYGSSYRYWIVLYANQLTDPQWDWPLSGYNFQKYIENKYQEFDPYSTVHHYEKIITQYDYNTDTTTTNTIIIDEDTYNSLTSSSQTYTLPTGQVSVNIEKNAVSYYTYELNLNESKRNIIILNNTYVGQLESEFLKLMS